VGENFPALSAPIASIPTSSVRAALGRQLELAGDDVGRIKGFAKQLGGEAATALAPFASANEALVAMQRKVFVFPRRAGAP
jgi:hypothetical protein